MTAFVGFIIVAAVFFVAGILFERYRASRMAVGGSLKFTEPQDQPEKKEK